jgi:hypothetical protein
MAKRNSTSSTPKRGAFPTPRHVLADAKPYKPKKPEKSGLAGGQPSPGSDSPEEFREQPNRGSREKSRL